MEGRWMKNAVYLLTFPAPWEFARVQAMFSRGRILCGVNKKIDDFSVQHTLAPYPTHWRHRGLSGRRHAADAFCDSKPRIMD